MVCEVADKREVVNESRRTRKGGNRVIVFDDR